MKKRISVFFLLVLAFLLCAAGCASATAPVVKVGKESIPSLYSVVGEKKITGTSTGVGTGGAEVELTYQGVSLEELNYYIEALVSDGYMVTQEAQASGTAQSYQIGKEASSDGYIILISFLFENGGSTVIHYTVAQGTITPETVTG